LALQIDTTRGSEETDIHGTGINKFRNTFFLPYITAVYVTEWWALNFYLGGWGGKNKYSLGEIERVVALFSTYFPRRERSSWDTTARYVALKLSYSTTSNRLL
jgi:hypothetical protein